MHLFSFFRTEMEALHLALSKDGFTFDSVNRNRPVLEGTVNTCTLRDPFLIQSGHGVFHLLASDGWESTSIIHASSNDLIDWSEQAAVPVMDDVPGTRNSWAPEAFYDKESGLFRLIWSSTVCENPAKDERDHRIWSCETEDFHEFAESRLFFDPGYNVIDATVVPYGDAYLMAFKDERGENRKRTEYKALRTALSLRGAGPFESVSELITPSLVEGPALYKIDGLWMMLYDYFHHHHYGASLSEDGIDWRVSGVEVILPEGARHGSVIEIDDEVANRLKCHFG